MSDGGLQLAFPFQLDPQGRVASTDYAQHVEQLILQLLFTSPGERVNRPSFGCGLLARVFQPDDSAVASAVQVQIVAALHTWLSDVLEPRAVEVTLDDARLTIDIVYVILRDEKTYRTRVER